MWVGFGLLDLPGEFEEKDNAEQLEAVKPASFSCKTIAHGAKVPHLGWQSYPGVSLCSAPPHQQGLGPGKGKTSPGEHSLTSAWDRDSGPGVRIRVFPSSTASVKVILWQGSEKESQTSLGWEGP